MEWVTVRLLVNSWRGLIGDVVRVPAQLATVLVLRGHAEIVRRLDRAA